MQSNGIRSAPPPGTCPWLVYYHDKTHKEQTFCCNISGPLPVKTYRKEIPVLQSKLILSCSYGWLVLYDYKSSRICLSNSSTFETIYLPRLEFICPSDHGYLLTSSPDTPDCKVLLFLRNVPSIMCCGVRDEEWSEIRYREQLKVLDPRREEGNPMEGNLVFRNPIICGGKIYAKLAVGEVAIYPDLWSIEMVEEPLAVGALSRINDYPTSNHPHSSRPQKHVVESEGELFSLIFRWRVHGTRHRELLVIEVSKLNFDTMVWEKLESIKNRSFFVCRNYCLSCPVYGSGYIYFFKCEDPSLYCYSIEDESVLMSLPAPDLPTPWLSPLWIMPEVVIRGVRANFRAPRLIPARGGWLSLAKHYLDNVMNRCWELQHRPQVVLVAALYHWAKRVGSSIFGRIAIYTSLMPEDYCNDNNEEQKDTILLNLKGYFEEDLRKNASEQQLFDLPFDILQDVIKHLEPLDYMTFRALSRICRSIALHINWRTSLSGTNTNLSFPLLMFALKHQKLYNFMDPRINHNYFIKIPEILEDTTVRYSNNGWLLMSRSDIVHLYNPFTGDIVSYTSPFELEENFFFVSKPSRSGCFLVSISFCREKWVIINIRHPGGNEWIREVVQNNVHFKTYNSPVFFQEAFYYLDESGYLGKLKIEEENFTWEVFDQIRVPCSSFHRNFLVECGGELLSVFVARAGKWVRVYKLNQSKRAWEVVSNLSNYTLYLSRCSSFSLVASPGVGNRIYFARLHSRGIVSYSLDTEKWHFFGSLDSSSNFYATKLLLNSCWIKPSWC